MGIMSHIFELIQTPKAKYYLTSPSYQASSSRRIFNTMRKRQQPRSIIPLHFHSHIHPSHHSSRTPRTQTPIHQRSTPTKPKSRDHGDLARSSCIGGEGQHKETKGAKSRKGRTRRSSATPSRQEDLSKIYC